MDTKNNQISDIITNHLNSTESKEKYLTLLNSRIEENRKLINNLFLYLVVTALSFPLIVETKITEIIIGPFKLSDNTFIISIIPTFFALCHYKYISVFIDLEEQNVVYYCLTSKIFSIEEKSYLNERIKPFSFLHSVLNHHFIDSMDSGKLDWSCLLGLFYFPIILLLGLSPSFFEFYSVKTLYQEFGLNSLLNWLAILIPIIIGILSLMIYYQGKENIKKLKAKTIS